jgi:hypothetical protein
MAALFALAAAVQFNDPDPLRWVVVYGTACVLSVLAAAGRRVAPAIYIAFAVLAAGWAGTIVAGGPGAFDFRHMFDQWEMRSASVEEAREATGLFIVTAWMIVLAVRSRRVLAASIR